ncbi:unnamed protein product [Schistosoma bovis]|nr:unnamed protein product [Schistosoma bovis]CAH8549360.1 unnamed protein product [Schistosoma bovis]
MPAQSLKVNFTVFILWTLSLITAETNFYTIPIIVDRMGTMKFTFSEVNVTFTLDRTLTLQCKQRTTVLKLTPPTKEEKRAHGGNRPCSFTLHNSSRS